MIAVGSSTHCDLGHLLGLVILGYKRKQAEKVSKQRSSTTSASVPDSRFLPRARALAPLQDEL